MRRHRWPAEDATSRRGISDVALEGAIADLRSFMGSVLSERELGLLRLRYGPNDVSPRTWDEIGQVYGVTRWRVRQIEELAVAKLRAAVTAELAPVLEDLLDAGLGALPDHVTARLLGREQPVWYRQGADAERVYCPRHQAFHLISRFRRSEPLCGVVAPPADHRVDRFLGVGTR